MLSKILGLIDLTAAAFLLLAGFDIIFTGFFILVILILLGKSLIFITDWASWVDIIAVILMALVLFNVYTFVNFLAFLWLLQKGAMSLIS
ncbi:hypothetical protein J4426_00130 [Candidatus Woesearchaeota archaeon]|nr:hypothetical protein [Candidatus Woesearchaeota archaeon]